MLITSAANYELKNIRKLLTDAAYRREQKLFALEGFKILQFARGIRTIYVREDTKLPAVLAQYPCRTVAKKIFNTLSELENPQGVLAVCALPSPPEFSEQKKYIFLDRLQDPGNLGTIIRTAAAFGLDGLICNKGCADVYAPKVVRAAMGAVFTLDILFKEISELSGNILAAELSGEHPGKITGGYVLAIGNEGQGLSAEVLAKATRRIALPFDSARAESLNAAVSAGILMYLAQY